MLKPSKEKQQEVKRGELARIIAMNILSFQGIRSVQRYIKKKLPVIVKMRPEVRERELGKVVAHIEEVYGKVFEDIVKGIKGSRVAASIEQHYLAEQTLGQKLTWRGVSEDLPTTQDYRITRRILSEKSILRRNKKAATRVALIIKKELDKGSSIPNIQKKVDIELGLRDKKGNTTHKQLAKLKQGKFAHANGHFYQTYRIARTESMRMASLQTHDTFKQLKRKGFDVRLELIAVIDSRTREQSIMMNRQVSDEDGKFLYPNGMRYKLGEQPVQWAANDRETAVPIFDGFETRPKPIYRDLAAYKRQLDA